MTEMIGKLARTPVLYLLVFAACAAALALMGETAQVRAQSGPPAQQGGGATYTMDDAFKFFGYIAVGLSALTAATAAVFVAMRKSALAEWKELAESRKGKIAELQLEIEHKRSRISNLEHENEELEKKNLRLQDDRKP